MRSARAASDVASIDADLVQAFAVLREKFAFPDGSSEDTALASIETFCAVALKVMRKTNPSKIRDAARTIEIKAHLDGVPVIRGAA